MLEPPAYAKVRQQAQTAVDAGDLDGARALLATAVESGRSRLAEGDPELLETMRQLAGTHTRAGEPLAARRLLEEAVAAGHRMAGTDPLAVMLAHDLGAAAEQLGNRHEARTQFGRVADLGPAALGEEHWAVTRARSYLDTGESMPSESAPTAPVFTAASFAEPPPPPPAPAAPAGRIPPLPGQAAPPSPPQPVAAMPASPATRTAGSLPGPGAAGAGATGAGVAGAEAAGAGAAGAGTAGARAAGAGVAGAGVAGAGAAGARAAGTDPARRVLPWVLAGSAVILVLALVVLLVRAGGDEGEPAALNLPSLPTGATTPAAKGGLGAAPTPSASPSPAGTSAPSRAAATTTAAAPPPARPTTAAATVRTRIVSPAANSSVPWPFDATFAVSAADVAATGTVVSLSICVAGMCFLDGKVDIVEGRAAPYTVYLGSTKPEGTGVPWTLRLDRLPKAAYAKLVADRDAAIKGGTWGVTDSTPVGALNPAPVSTLTVTKK